MEEDCAQYEPEEEDYEVDFKQILASIEVYMKNMLEKELREFDEIMREKTKSCPKELVDYEEIEKMREMVYKNVRERMLEKIKNAFSKNNLDSGVKVIEMLYYMVLTKSLIKNHNNSGEALETYKRGRHGPENARQLEFPDLTEEQYEVLEKRGRTFTILR